MSPRLPSLSGKEIARLAESIGFRRVSQRGSHAKYRHLDGRSTIIPMHGNEAIGPGLLLKILADIGIDADEIRQ